ncbi:Guanine nucleotide-binding protein G(i) subunit alpha-1 [Entophlyctis sp. JEL0112]|nr:Guanine nucleotide-binding protein G(i) subunit alpha-1 [Entophlyctis sp. JEL0112]
MGACQSKNTRRDERSRHRASISHNSKAAAERKKESPIARVNFLLLGAGESGKTTIFKQMKLINGIRLTDEDYLKDIKDLISGMNKLHIPYGFDPETPRDSGATFAQLDEKNSTLTLETPDSRYSDASSVDFSIVDLQASFGRQKKPVVDAFAESAMQQYERNGGEWGQQGNAAYAAQFLSFIELDFNSDSHFPDLLVDAVKTVWADPGVNFLNDIDRIFSLEYVPTVQDVLLCRDQTQSVQEVSFTINKTVFRVCDIGGQRTQRKKWAAYFEGINAILFVASIAGFDKTTSEDSATNRLLESLLLFESICNNPVFKKTPIFLLMNKIDQFKEKLKCKQISSYFTDYQGQNTYEEGCAYFKNMFLKVNKYRDRKLHVHFLSAIDTHYTTKVLESINSITLASAKM